MIIFFLVSAIFVARNVDRIIYELDFYQANFKQNMFFFTDKKHFRIDNKLKDNFSMYSLRMDKNDLDDIKKLSRKLSYDVDRQISIADIMRYCIINHKQDAEKYFKEIAYDKES